MSEYNQAMSIVLLARELVSDRAAGLLLDVRYVCPVAECSVLIAQLPATRIGDVAMQMVKVIYSDYIGE